MVCARDSLFEYKQTRASLWHVYKSRLCCLMLRFCPGLAGGKSVPRWVSVHCREARTNPSHPSILNIRNRKLEVFQNLWMLHLSISAPGVWSTEQALHSSVTAANCQQLLQWARSWLKGLGIKVSMQHLLSHCLIPEWMGNTQCK